MRTSLILLGLTLSSLLDAQESDPEVQASLAQARQLAESGKTSAAVTAYRAIIDKNRYMKARKLIDSDTELQTVCVEFLANVSSTSIDELFPELTMCPETLVANWTVDGKIGGLRPMFAQTVAAEHPPEIAGEGGYVDLRFDVSPNGEASSIVVLFSTSSFIERPTIDTIAKAQFVPAKLDGKPVWFRDMQYRYRF